MGQTTHGRFAPCEFFGRNLDTITFNFVSDIFQNQLIFYEHQKMCSFLLALMFLVKIQPLQYKNVCIGLKNKTLTI